MCKNEQKYKEKRHISNFDVLFACKNIALAFSLKISRVKKMPV